MREKSQLQSVGDYFGISTPGEMFRAGVGLILAGAVLTLGALEAKARLTEVPAEPVPTVPAPLVPGSGQ